MAEIRYRQGETVFAEDDPSDYVLRIIAGEVEVVKGVGDQAVVLGHLRGGEFVGEMGVLEDRPRSATVRASSDVVAEQRDRERFLQLISADGETAFNLMVRLSERLAAIDRAYAEAVAATADRSTRFPLPLRPPAALPEEWGTITIFAGADGLAEALPEDGRAITELPFTVGRYAEADEPSPTARIQLFVKDSEPYRLSRLHFWLEHGRDGYRVRDLGSTLGTQVNGASIGHHFANDNAALQVGENTVIAGGVGSPYVFRVVVAKP